MITNGRKGEEGGREIWMDGRRGGREGGGMEDCVSVYSSDYIMMT